MPALLTCLLAPLAAALLIPACADEERAARGPAGGAEPAELVVTETLTHMPRYTEGSVGFLRVRDGAGELLVDGPVESPLRRDLPPGSYHLVSFQRPCDGNCGLLDPPTDRCEKTVGLEAGEVLKVNVVLHQDGGCTMRVSRRRAG